MISDSIAKYIDNVDGLVVQSYRGATISQLESYILNEDLRLHSFDFIIFHVGTNDISRFSTKMIMQSFKFLIRSCRNVARQVPIGISAILPRPVDFDTTRDICVEVNIKLEEFCKMYDLKFIRSYKRFLHAGRPIRRLFAHQDGGLHLNYEGTRQLRQCFINTIRHC